MELFQPIKPLFPNDLERNRLLRIHQEFSLLQPTIEPLSSRFRTKLILLIFGIPLRILKSQPELRKHILRIGSDYKRYFPVWFKKIIKIPLGIIPLKTRIAEDGIYEINPLYPAVLELGFGLPTAPNPEVSIIIPVHNHIETTLSLLHKLRLNTDTTKFEIIIIDDASTDSTKEILTKIRGVKVVTQTINVGYLLATNSAIKFCEGKHICLLNNDTLPESGWLDSLVRTMNSDDQIAIAGSMLLSSDGKVAEVGSQIFQNRQIWNLGRWATRGNELFSFTREVDYCSAAAILVDGSFFRSLGGFDERYVPAYYEDTDLATTAWSQGRKVVYVHDSVVKHIEGVSHGTDTSQGLKAYQEVNREKFWDKWSKLIELPWSLDEVPRYEADRDSKGIIVFIDNYIPSLESNAGATRAYRIIEAMRRLKFHVIVIPASRGIEILNRDRLHQNGVEIYQSYDQALSNLSMRSDRINSFWVSRVDVAEIIFPKIKTDFPGKAIYFDTVDLHYLRDLRNIEINGSKNSIYGSNIVNLELSMCTEATKTVVVAGYEKKYLEEAGITSPVYELFMPQDPIPDIPKVKSKGSILFVGNFTHSPNIRAVEWLVDEVLPKITSSIDDPVRLQIIGAGLPDEIRGRLDSKNVDYLGWQESLEEFYSEARMVVVPLLYGAGKKGKLGEAILNNCPVISTSVGVEGYSIESEKDFLLADTAEDFAQAIMRLWNDSELTLALATSAKNRILDDLGTNKFQKDLAEILGIDQD
jgi:GT2 family glycosyltransferase